MTTKELGSNEQEKVSANWQLPLIVTKLSSPKGLGPLMVRNRLNDLAPVVIQRKVTSVQAPAGYGKTTLLSQWREAHLAQGAVVAWVSLSEEDNSAHRMLSYMVAALLAAQPGLCDGAWSALNSGPSVPMRVAEAMLISELEACAKEVVIILDDYHLITDAEVHDLLTNLIRNSPANFHLVIATRFDLPLHLARLRLENKLLEVSAEDLRLELGELEGFINGVLGLDLPISVAKMLHEISEGWIAGVQIAALSPRFKEEPKAYLKEFASGSKNLSEYLHEVVMDVLPPDLVQVLLRCSILDRLNAPLCEAVAGVNDGQALLDRLSKLNLFLFALDEQNNWFRFHRLFLDFLRESMWKLDDDELARLHRTACDWFAGEQLWAEAVSHALAIGDTNLAQKFIEHCALDMLGQSRGARLLNWRRKLPESTFNDNIDLRLAMVFAHLLMMDLPPVHGMLRNIQTSMQAKAHDATERQHDRQVQFTIASAVLALLEDRLDGARLLTEFEIGQLEKLQGFEFEVASFILSYVYLHQLRLEQLAEIQQQSARRQDKPHFSFAYRKSFEGLGWFLRGRLDRAQFLFEEALEASEKIAGRRSMVTVAAMASKAKLHYERNDLEQAEELLAVAMTIPLDASVLITVESIYTTLARINNVKGERQEAWELLDALGEIAAKHGWQRLESCCYRERIHSEILHGDGAAAAAELSLFEQYLATVELDSIAAKWVQDDWLMSAARVGCLYGDSGDVQEQLVRRVDVLERKGALYRSAKFRMLLALLQWSEGDLQTAKATLMPALKLGKKQGFCRTFIDEIQGGRRLLKHITANLTVKEEAISSYLQNLIEAMAPPLAPLAVSQSLTKLSDVERLNIAEVTDREHEVLALIGNGLFNKEVASVLGISEGTVKWHLKNLYSKLNVSSRTQALKKAQDLGLIIDS